MRTERLKHVCAVVDVRAGRRQLPLLAVSIHFGVVRRDELTDDEPRADDLSAYRICAPGDIVLNRMRAFQGAIGMASQHGIVSPDYLVLRPRPDVYDRYLHYVFRSSAFVGEMIARLRGIGSTDTGSVRTPRINADDLLDIPVDLPRPAEQRAIAAYLDRETARIDALIAAKRRMLHLLDEKWRGMLNAVIWSDATATAALMHLVDPARPVMYGIVLPGPDVGPGGVAIVKGGDVAQGRLSWDLLCKTTPEIEAPYARARLRGGDLVFAIRGGIGDVAIVPEVITGANITQDVARISTRRGVDARWLMYALQSPTAQSDTRRRVTGATITGLNIWELDRVRVPSSTTAQQLEHRDALDVLSAGLSSGRTALLAQCSLLKERRQALITAAVTGQIAVPVAA